MGLRRGSFGVKNSGVVGRGLKDESGVSGEVDFAAALNPALVDRDGCAIVTEASRDVALTGGDAHDEADDA